MKEEAMTALPEFHKYDGLGLAELVRTKQVTPTELVEEAISRIEVHNPKINAVIYKMYDRARGGERRPSRRSLQGCAFLVEGFARNLRRCAYQQRQSLVERHSHVP
jgi:amidase